MGDLQARRRFVLVGPVSVGSARQRRRQRCRRQRLPWHHPLLPRPLRSPVEEVLAEAERAGAKVVKPAEQTPWGGSSGYFADPDGFLWKVASGGGDDQPFAE